MKATSERRTDSLRDEQIAFDVSEAIRTWPIDRSKNKCPELDTPDGFRSKS